MLLTEFLCVLLALGPVGESSVMLAFIYWSCFWFELLIRLALNAVFFMSEVVD